MEIPLTDAQLRKIARFLAEEIRDLLTPTPPEAVSQPDPAQAKAMEKAQYQWLKTKDAAAYLGRSYASFRKLRERHKDIQPDQVIDGLRWSKNNLDAIAAKYPVRPKLKK